VDSSLTQRIAVKLQTIKVTGEMNIPYSYLPMSLGQVALFQDHLKELAKRVERLESARDHFITRFGTISAGQRLA
jgi:hypothetical protein